MERIIDVYYGRDNLPYKDEARTIHFPVAGSEFLGASQTTTIRFHYEQIGTDENVYTVESKRPDGKTGSQLLSKNTTEHYAEMSLSGWYSACKGDLFLSLKVYRGGTTATYNETTQLWEVNGVPVIESTGAIKLAINYTPMGRYENYEDAVSTYQDVLAALGDKLDTIKGIVGVSGLSQVDTTEYEEGQLFFNIDDKALYQLVNGSIVPFLEVYSKSETNDLLDNKADKSTTYTKTETDQLLTNKQDKLVSGTNIKTINGQSILGSGDLPISGGGGSAEWGSIGGDIADQTDLQDELQDIREVAEGKTKTWVLSYSVFSFTGMNYQNSLYYDPTNGEFKEFESAEQFNTWTSGLTIINSYFNSQNASVNVGFNVTTRVLIFNVGSKNLLVKVSDAFTTQYKLFHRGDVILITELDVPDRWYNAANVVFGATFFKLETSKINLDNYSTKSETSTEVNKVAHDIAVEYDENTLYGSGDLCIKDKLLYKCNTDDTTGTWDSNKWDLTTVNSELGIIKGDIQHIANKWVGAYIGDETAFTTDMNVGDIVVESTGGQFLINEITFSGTTLTKVVLVGLEDNGNPVVHTFENGGWFSSNYINSNFVDLTSAQTIKGLKSIFSNNDYLNFIWNADRPETKALRIYKSIGSRAGVVFGINGIALHGIWFDGSILPFRDIINIGSNAYPFNKIYVSNGIGDGKNANYKLTIPDTSSWTADKEIATTETFGFKRYTNTEFASLSGSAFTDAIKNGAIVSGSIAIQGGSLNNPVFHPAVGYVNGNYYGIVSYNPVYGHIENCLYRVGEGGPSSAIYIQSNNIIRYNNVGMFNGKEVPAYPTNPTTPQALIYDTDNTLKYTDTQKQWFGTQAQYDALGTYDSNTIYNILES